MTEIPKKASPTRNRRAISSALPILLAILVLCGCRREGDAGGGPDNASANKRPLPDAKTVLEEMHLAYTHAESYADQGKLRWQYFDGQQWHDDAAPFATAFLRPNQFALRVHGLQLACNGTQLAARINDPLTSDYDGQFVLRKAPSNLTTADLFSDVEMAKILSDPLLGGTPWPLRMLLDDAAIRKSIEDSRPTMLPVEKIGPQDFYRVQWKTDSDTVVLWIHPESLVLRQMHVTYADKQSPVRNLVIDLADAQLDGDVAAARFELEMPATARRVDYFVEPPPADELPSPLLARQVADFSLTGADERQITSKSLQGKNVVLVWFLDRDESHVTLRQLETVYQKYRTNPRVVFFAVSPQAEPVATEQLQQILDRQKVTIPLARDLKAVGRDVFGVPGAPTVVVLDEQQRMQAFQKGVDPELAQQLPQLLDQMLAGNNPAGQLRQAIEEEQIRYQRQLAGASSENASTVLELAGTRIAKPTKPARLKLRKLWTTAEIESPGNVLVMDEQPPRILVHDLTKDWRTLVELSPQGTIVKRRQLPLPDTAAIAFLRTALDKDGRRLFAGTARLAKQVYLLDENWQVVATYPGDQQQHEGVSDVALVDFKGDGQLQLCVGFWGPLGVHGVSTAGRRLWSNRAAAPVVSLAAGPRNEAGWRQLLATTDRGQVVAVNGFGRNDAPQQIDHHAITNLFAADWKKDQATSLLGVAVATGGEQMGLALDNELNVAWDVPLPSGAHRSQIQWVTSGQLLPGAAGQWVFAGSDGSVGIVSDDASFFDSFRYGRELTGIAVAELDGRAVLILATASDVTAWQVELPQGPAS